MTRAEPAFPALHRLAAAKRLDLPVLGVANSEWDDGALRRYATGAVEAAQPQPERPALETRRQRLVMVAGADCAPPHPT
jgi:glucose-6-phosphate 1-dehydrogenase